MIKSIKGDFGLLSKRNKISKCERRNILAAKLNFSTQNLSCTDQWNRCHIILGFHVIWISLDFFNFLQSTQGQIYILIPSSGHRGAMPLWELWEYQKYSHNSGITLAIVIRNGEFYLTLLVFNRADVEEFRSGSTSFFHFAINETEVASYCSFQFRKWLKGESTYFFTTLSIFNLL